MADVALTENQTMLRDTTRRFIEDRVPVTVTRRAAEGKADAGVTHWRECAAQGWLGLFVREADGGMAELGGGAIDAAIVAEELGRAVFAGPFLPASVVADAISRRGTAAQRRAVLPSLVEGGLRAAWCYAGMGPLSGIDVGSVRASRAGNGHALDGVASYVEDAEAADWLLVTAADGTGVSQFLLPRGTAGVTIEPVQALDLGRTLATVRFDRVEAGPDALLGTAGEGAADFEAQLQLALVLQCAETVGVVDRALEFTLDYVRQRVAFGRVIGSYQALKHRLADHLANLEGAKALTAHAARAVATGQPDAAVAVSAAKGHTGRAATEIVRDCVQMHGGIGLTWDHDLHFYLRRAVSNEALLGAPLMHYERLSRLSGL